MNNYCVGSRRLTGSFALQNLAVSFADKPHIGLVKTQRRRGSGALAYFVSRQSPRKKRELSFDIRIALFVL